MMQKFGHVEIARSIALMFSQHGDRGCIEPTPIADAVEALHAEGAEFARGRLLYRSRVDQATAIAVI
jgi:hypothetical protein